MVQLNKLSIRGIEVPSKFWFAPINTGLAVEGNPTDELISFHQKRSNKYTGVNFVGNVAINKQTVTNNGTLYINSNMSRFAELSEAIIANGSLPGVQVACFRSAFSPIFKWRNLNPSHYIELVRNEVQSLTKDDIRLIVLDFQNAISRLYDCGFRVIQLHGAHGYFLNTFLSQTFNLRNDEYGKNPALILEEILNGVDQIHDQCILDLRISVFETTIEEKLTETSLQLLDLVYSIDKLDVISISNGIYNIDKRLIYPNLTLGTNFMFSVMEEYIKSHPEKLWNLSGNINELNHLEPVTDNLTFSIGRSIIADENFISKHFNGG